MTSATDTSELSVQAERKPGSQVELRIEAPPSEVDAAVEAALRRLGQRLRVPGFRPGKAPAAIVERLVGWETLRQEAVDGLLPTMWARATEREKLDPVGDPEVKLGEFERGQPFSITATVTVRPEVELGDYPAELRVEAQPTEVSEAQVDEVIAEVRRRHSDLVAVERAALAGDVLSARLTMRRDGEVVGAEGEERDVELEGERLLPGLADALVGISAGETRTVDVTLPDDYSREELRGVTAQVEVEVLHVRERRLPPLDDSLASLDEHGETLAELRDHYRRRMEEIAAEEDRERYETRVLEALRDRVVVDVPEPMVEREIDNQLAEMEMRLSGAGLQLERFLEYSGQTMEQVRGERREAAVQRVKLDLALEALARAEGLEVDEADVEREERRLATGRKLSRDQHRRLHSSVHRDLLLRGAAQRAIEIARGEG